MTAGENDEMQITKSTAARLIWSLLALVVFGAGPLLVTLVTALIVSVLGCQLDESNLHPCPVLGVDIGRALSLRHVLWLGFFTLPIAAIGVLIWLGFAIALVLRLRRATPR
jgi:hypothetical protein